MPFTALKYTENYTDTDTKFIFEINGHSLMISGFQTKSAYPVKSLACTHKVLLLLVFFESSKVNVQQVAISDENMAVGMLENLLMLHVYKLETDHTTFF